MGNKWWKIPIVILAIVSLAFIGISYLSKGIFSSKDEVKMESSLSEKMRVEFDKKEGVNAYSKSAIASEEKQLDSFLKKKAPELYKLKKDNKAIFGSIQTSELKIDTTVINNIDTALKDSVSDVRLAYIVNPHYKLEIKSSSDSTSAKFKAVDSLKFTLDKDYRVRVTHSNPFLETTEINSFYVKPKKQNTLLKIGVGVLIGSVTVLLLK